MKHKHTEVIKAWADGAKIQMLVDSGWKDVERPNWYDGVEYRAKPAEPEVKRFAVKAVLSLSAGPLFYPVPDDEANMWLTFENSKLKNVRVQLEKL